MTTTVTKIVTTAWGRALRVGGIPALLLVLGACSSGPSQPECEAALKHLVELEVDKGVGARELSDDMKAALVQQKAEISASLQASARSSCEKKAPRELVLCLTNAKTLEEAKNCDGK